MTTELAPITALSPTRDAAQDLGAVADPDVRADDDVALVDALQADRRLGVDDDVVEVDEHRPVGDHALLADPDPLVGGDRAPPGRSRSWRRSRRRPRGSGSSSRAPTQTKRPKRIRPVRPDLQLQPRAEEDHAVGRASGGRRGSGAGRGGSASRSARTRGEHPVAAAKRSAASPPRSGLGTPRGRRAARRARARRGPSSTACPRLDWRRRADRRLAVRRWPCHDPPPMSATASLTERLLEGDKRALARAISLIENGDPRGRRARRRRLPAHRDRRGSSASPALPASARAR